MCRRWDPPCRQRGFLGGKEENEMKIQVTGDHTAAQTLRAQLKSVGYEVLDVASKAAADYVIQLEQGTQPNVALEGLRGVLADEALHAIAGLTGVPVEWRAAIGGSEKVIRVIASAVHGDAVGLGLLRAVLNATGHGTPAASGGGLLGAISRLFTRSK
jgi:hypothetical protein